MSFFFFKGCTRIFRPASTRFLSSSTHSVRRKPLISSYAWVTVFGITLAGIGASWNTRSISLDSQVQERINEKETADDLVVDPATSITFPQKMQIPSSTIKYPTMTLIGAGVRTVSFLGVKVYSIGFYADLSSPNLKIPLELSPEEKVDHLVKNTACLVRIVPTRSTSYTHLRDAFMRALQARLAKGIKDGTITEETAIAASSPLRDLKGLFPNSTLAKHTPLDIFLTSPSPNKPRALILRDLGSVENNWVATEFMLNYFDHDAPSPKLKDSVFASIKPYSK